MIKYFDFLLVRIYKQWLKWGEKDIPKLKSILTIAFFQSMNLLAVYFLIRSLFEKGNWVLPKLHIVVLMFFVLSITYFRFYKQIKFEKLLIQYNKSHGDEMNLRPWLYFLITVLILVILRIFHLFPVSTLKN